MIDLPTDDTPVPLAAEMYAALGFDVIPLHGVVDGKCTCGAAECEPRSAGKHPLSARWQKLATHDQDAVRELFRGHRWNIGVMLGTRYVALDVDGMTGYESLKKLGDLPETLTSESGSRAGEHRIFAYAPHHDPNAITNRAVLPKLDVKTRTGQIVVAPSLHRAGHRYTWRTRVLPAVLPDAVYDMLLPPRRAPVIPMVPRGGDLWERARAYVARIDPAISGSGGHAQTFAAARAIAGFVAKGLPRSEAWALFVQYNGRCSPPWSERELEHKFDDALRAHTIPEIQDRPRPGAPSAGPVAAAAATSAPARPTADQPHRAHMLWVNDKHGRPKAVRHVENVVCVLRYHPEWTLPNGAPRIRLDQHAQLVTVVDPPWRESHAPSPTSPTRQDGSRAWTDTDSARLSSWLRRESGIELDMSTADCERAVDIVAASSPYHPVKDWLASLHWDGTPRLADAPERYFGAAGDLYTRSVFRWWMIAAVARSFDPGCKADNVLILEGPQGLRKSSALRTLASPAWFTDTPIDLHSKDAFISLSGKLIVELAELESLRKADASRAKAFFTSSSDTYRPPYGRRLVTIERGCVFAGTVNDATYLQDQTGNRRYWPIACSRVDLEALAHDREQLWAEAVFAYQARERWWPTTPEELAACEQAQAPRAQGDEWEAVLARWLERHPGVEPTAGELLSDVIGLPRDRWDRSSQIRVGLCMQRLGWTRRQRRTDSGTKREWFYSTR